MGQAEATAPPFGVAEVPLLLSGTGPAAPPFGVAGARFSHFGKPRHAVVSHQDGEKRAWSVRDWLLCVTVLSMVCGIAGICSGAFERQPESVRACGMGGAGSAIAGNVWGALMNPAALAGMPVRIIAVSTAPSPFGLQELRRTACAYAEPFGRLTASVSALRYGYELYREVTLGAACGYDCGEGVRVGGTVTLNSVSIPGYGQGSCAGLDAGVLWQIVPGLQFGASALNWNAPSPGKSRESIPRTFQAGLAYAPPGGFLVACDIAEDPRFSAELRLGAELSVADLLFLRAGVSTDPSSCAAGVGVRILPLDIEYAFSRHQELGFTHRFGLSLRLGGP